MTYQANPKSAGFRELNAEELAAVSGGTEVYQGHIYATRSKPSGNTGGLGAAAGFVFDAAGGGGTSHNSGGATDHDYGSGDDGLVFDEDGNLDAIIVEVDKSTGLPKGYVMAPNTNMFMYKVDANGNQVGPLVFSPEGLERHNTDVMANFDWREFSATMGTIAVGSVAGAGNSVRAVIGLVGGAVFGGMGDFNEP